MARSLWLAAALALAACGDVSTSSRSITTHCMSHVLDAKAGGLTTVEDCDIDIDSKSKSAGFP